jgi:hypothetical protein
MIQAYVVAVKVKCKVYPVHYTKAYRRSWRLLILNLGTRRRWMVTSLPAGFTPRERAPVRFEQEDGCAGLGVLEKRP